jgi:PAS domain S-box-containing protein
MSELNAATLQWLNDLTAQGILTTDADLRVQGWNRWLENQTGHRAHDVIGRELLELYPELVARRMDRWYRLALRGQVMVLAHRLHRYLLPIRLIDRQPGVAWMQQSARIAPLTTDGRIIGTITVIEDVTERELREAELRRQIAALEALHDVSSGILSLDLPQCLQRLVETTAALVRAPTVAVVLRYGDRLHVEASRGGPSDANAMRVNLTNSPARAVIRSGQPVFVADLSTRQDLAPLVLESQCLIATPLIADSSVIGALIIESPDTQVFSAIDQRQVLMLATQAALGIRNAQIYREAQEAIRVRDTFLSIASHELKTPLTTILGNVQMLQRRNARDNGLSERNKRTLDIVAAQAARLNRMVTALLDISRIQTGQLSIERTPLDLGLLAQRVFDDLQPTLDNHQVVLNLPDKALIVGGDELRLEQVLQNLVQNAVKYSPGGGVVDVHVEQRNQYACVRVTDQGIGIPQEALSQLFSRFYRADNVQVQHISGMGIGLYVVKEIVDLHGGHVEVTSQEGVGSTFTIYLPLA